MRIRSYGPAADTLPEHELDVVVLCKRYASDDNLAQESSQVLDQISIPNFVCQEPMLALPFKYLEYLPPCPAVARYLNLPKAKKRQDYLFLARALLKRYPTEIMSRGIKFLVETAENRDPGTLADLCGWFLGPFRIDDIQIRNTAILARIAPAMKFRAALRR